MSFNKTLLVLALISGGVTAAPVITKVYIVVHDDESMHPTGALYRIGPEPGKREWIADIAADGTINPTHTCTGSEKLRVQPSQYGLQAIDDAIVCTENPRFRFFLPILASTAPFRTASGAAIAGNYAAAHMQFSAIAAQARANGEPENARIASDAAVQSAAKVLGDANLDKFIARDSTQNDALVLTPVGEKKLKQFQREAMIPATGKLDFATQKAMVGRVR
jgi:hypothetical protein